MDSLLLKDNDLMDLFYNREDVERIYVCTEEPYETDIEPNVDWYQIVEFGYRGIAVEDQWGYSAKPIKYEDVTMARVCIFYGKKDYEYTLVRLDNQINDIFDWTKINKLMYDSQSRRLFIRWCKTHYSGN